MKRIITVLFAAGLLATLTTGCKEEYTTYSDKEYAMFADTLATYAVLQDQEYFEVPVTTTVACDYDRTFGVEIIDKGSNAIEGRHYRLLSNTLTVKAGERRANVQVKGLYDNIENTDSLGFILKLVMPEQLKWEMYHDQTKVVMVKSCPFDIHAFTGWCVLTSNLLKDYGGLENQQSMQRLIRTELHPTESNTLILHDLFFTGYDITVRLDPEDPAEPLVTMDKDQIISDEAGMFGQEHGDGKVLVRHSPLVDSYFNNCQNFVMLWTRVYVENMGESVLTLGDFPSVLEWVSDEEAERLRREEGM